MLGGESLFGDSTSAGGAARVTIPFTRPMAPAPTVKQADLLQQVRAAAKATFAPASPAAATPLPPPSEDPLRRAFYENSPPPSYSGQSRTQTLLEQLQAASQRRAEETEERARQDAAQQREQQREQQRLESSELARHTLEGLQRAREERAAAIASAIFRSRDEEERRKADDQAREQQAADETLRRLRQLQDEARAEARAQADQREADYERQQRERQPRYDPATTPSRPPAAGGVAAFAGEFRDLGATITSSRTTLHLGAPTLQPRQQGQVQLLGAPSPAPERAVNVPQAAAAAQARARPTPAQAMAAEAATRSTRLAAAEVEWTRVQQAFRHILDAQGRDAAARYRNSTEFKTAERNYMRLRYPAQAAFDRANQ